ncbi:Spx/MgsR family RNA polymerase-binding regulatory protein [Lactococcus taiwanensis]|uniref:Spx/MgsR family RNA polymerase-binding regulatory protein n=1 Tax=Lactococcus taiwanensis TaxID=1151742 RepID=UPI00190629A9|nr:Spx/MgsR family RNA polymerase-binding regulatory protein [Lactococcus taiwanensis]
MIAFYYASSCRSSKLARKWLIKHHLEFEEINIRTNGIRREILLKMLSMSELGIEDIVSLRSKCFREKKFDFNDITLNDLLEKIENNPELLKHPLILSDQHFQSGYNEENMRAFLSRTYRTIERKIPDLSV